jgi:DNA/RNA endonuclease G (NUC1)
MSDAIAAATKTAASLPDGNFTSLGDIRVAHLELMRQASEYEAVSSMVTGAPNVETILPSNSTIRAFLDKARQAGRVIGQESDRRGVQRILDYWSAEMVIRPATTTDDISPARLAPFEGDGGIVMVPVDAEPFEPGDAATVAVPPADAELTEEEEAERLRIRVAAQARQWEKTKYDGYLLRDEALAQAIELQPGEDIDAFIQASIEAEKNGLKRRERTKNLLITVFVALSTILAVAALYATDARKAAEEKAVEITMLNIATEEKASEIAKLNVELQAQIDARTSALDAAVKAREDEERARLQLEDALTVARQKADDAIRRESEQESAQVSLDSAIRLLVDGLVKDRIRLDDVNDRLREMAFVQIVGDVKSGALKFNLLPLALQVALGPLINETPSFLPDDLPGYQPNFLEAEIQLPTLTGALAEDVLAKQANYVNYSLVMSRSHRMAFYAAVNLDRSQRLVLQTAGGGLHRDTRILDNEQPDPAWYTSTVLPAQLASSGDVAWGPAFSGDPGTAALKLSLYTNVLSNSMPQPSSLATGIWTQLDNWVRNEHNPLAGKVTIFTGPVFATAEERQGSDAVPVPSAYWKVTVSSVSTAVKGEVRDPEFKVDAFLIPRDTGETEFNPSTFRVSIAELEQRTGIDFGYLIEWTDSTNRPGPDGRTVADELAAQVGMLDSARESERQAIRGELLAVLGNPALPIPERRKVVAALTNMASTVNMLPLTRDGRLNVLEALIWVPDELWRRPDWSPLWAQARVAAGDLEVRQDNRETNIGQKTRELLDRLKGQLGIRPSAQTVYFQFAGMTREAAEALSARMRAVGWAIPKPGEERTPLAAGKNEVRYNPDNAPDRVAAELLAADLTAAGQKAEAKPISGIGVNTLEIWVSI